MMKTIINTDERIKSSFVYIGYIVLKEIKKQNENKITMFELINLLKKQFKVIHYRQVVFTLMFLYSLELIDFSDPYIYKK